MIIQGVTKEPRTTLNKAHLNQLGSTSMTQNQKRVTGSKLSSLVSSKKNNNADKSKQNLSHIKKKNKQKNNSINFQGFCQNILRNDKTAN